MRREQGLRLQVEPRVDWFAIFSGLLRRGITLALVSQQTKVPTGTLQGWKQGAEPKHADGERIIAFYLQVTGESREKVPMTRCPEWLDR